MSDPNRWGFDAGFSVDFPRSITSVDGSLAGPGDGFTGYGTLDPAAQITLYSLYGNMIYRWERLYIPFGINISGASVTSAPLGLSERTSTVGLQFGLGYYLFDNLALEALVRSVAFDAMSSNYSVSGNSDFDSGTMTSLNLGIKVLF
jgi:hypothetical protein